MKFRLALNGAQQARLLLVAAVATGVLSTVAGRGTMAFFTTQVTSTGNQFTAGTLYMRVADGNQALNRTTVANSIRFDNMKPGDVVYAPMRLDNNGTLDLNYGIAYSTTTSGDQNLADALVLAIRGTGTGGGAGSGSLGTAAADAANACSDDNWTTPGTVWPDVVYASAPMDAGGEVLFAPDSPTPAMGRDLASGGGAETLCLRISWPNAGADNAFNNPVDGETNTTITFTFDGLVAADAQTNDAGDTTAGQ